jgi:CelD/BcsL family acetyltransferase involved in cellulose biosynthesis
MTTTRAAPRIEVIDERADLMGLAAEWDELLDDSSAPNVFLTWTWVSSWLETLGSHHQLLVVTARDTSDGRLVGVAPLAIETRAIRPLPVHRVLVMIGSRQAAPDHLDLILRRGHEHVAEALWSAISGGGWHLIDLNGLRMGSHLARLVSQRSGRAPLSIRATPCPYLELPAAWDHFHRGLGRNLRQNLGRYRRKLDREAGAPVIERAVSDPAEAEATVLDLAELHRRSRAAGSDATAFHDDGMVEFHRLVASRFAAEGKLRMHRLDVGDRVAAIIYCFRHGDVVSFYQTGYDAEFGRYGPGRRIMAAAIRAAIEEGAGEFDLLRGDELHKSRWGASVRHDQRLVVPFGMRGRLIHAAMRTVWAVRAARKRWPGDR